MTAPRLASLLLLLASLLPSPAPAQESAPAAPPGWDQDELASIEVLLPPGLEQLPYVRVHFAGDHLPKDTPEVIAYRGFLLDERPESFRVWCLDLLSRRMPPETI